MLNYETRFVKLAFCAKANRAIRSFTVTPFAQLKTSCTLSTGRNKKARQTGNRKRKREKKEATNFFFSSHKMKKKIVTTNRKLYTHTSRSIRSHAHSRIQIQSLFNANAIIDLMMHLCITIAVDTNRQRNRDTSSELSQKKKYPHGCRYACKLETLPYTSQPQTPITQNVFLTRSSHPIR